MHVTSIFWCKFLCPSISQSSLLARLDGPDHLNYTAPRTGINTQLVVPQCFLLL